MFQNVRKIDLDELKERTNNGFYYELDDEKFYNFSSNVKGGLVLKKLR